MPGQCIVAFSNTWNLFANPLKMRGKDRPGPVIVEKNRRF
ncbi:hypothetical protein GGD38_004249 [Chitinophagaceae bacterium OAS944]|nr:hypothetical protein [Chitinophagaceae bacterium OAS944]